MKVYLAGGMKGTWQDAVMLACSDMDITFIDPRSHGYTGEEEYTKWDLDGVSACDVLFACMTADNPSGLGMMLEIGYAARAGKSIIFVEDPADLRTPYYGMARVLATAAALDLDDGVRALRSLAGGAG